MKISNVGATKGATRIRRKAKKSSGKGSEFSQHLVEAAEGAEVSGIVDSPPATAVDAVLAVQEVPDSTEERSRNLAKRYGDSILDRLEELRGDLLIGAIPKDRLVGLAQAVRAKRLDSNDPRLNEIIDEIELRAEVEIAKFTRDI